MISKSLRCIALAGFIGICVADASAAVIERSCNCQGYAKSNGLESANNNYVEDIHQAAVYWCETGTRHPYAREAGGNFCTPPACPSGTIDLGVIVKECHGVKKSRFVAGTANLDNYAPAEAGCNYDSSSAVAADWFVSCDLECNRVRQCATASDR